MRSRCIIETLLVRVLLINLLFNHPKRADTASGVLEVTSNVTGFRLEPTPEAPRQDMDRRKDEGDELATWCTSSETLRDGGLAKCL